jgi:hypothetical protein
MLNQCKTILVLRNIMLQLFFLIFIRMGKQTRIDQNKRQVSISNIKTKTQMMIGAKVCVEHKFTNSRLQGMAT